METPNKNLKSRIETLEKQIRDLNYKLEGIHLLLEKIIEIKDIDTKKLNDDVSIKLA